MPSKKASPAFTNINTLLNKPPTPEPATSNPAPASTSATNNKNQPPSIQHCIIPVREADLYTLAQFMCASQFTQAVNRFLFKNWPAETTQISLCINSLAQYFKDPCVEMLKVIDNVEGDIVASLVLVRRRRCEKMQTSLKEEDCSLGGLPVGVNREFQLYLKRMLEMVQREMVGVDHFEISSIFVRPSSRNKGIGSQLVRICIDKARHAKVPLFLASVPSAHGFFRKQGFKDTIYADIDLSKWGVGFSGFGVYRIFGMVLET